MENLLNQTEHLTAPGTPDSMSKYEVDTSTSDVEISKMMFNFNLFELFLSNIG